MIGFEPTAPSSRTRCATKLRYIPQTLDEHYTPFAGRSGDKATQYTKRCGLSRKAMVWINIAGFTLLGIYLLGIWKFLSGFNHTTFNRDLFTRLALAILWPPLLLINKNFRSNFGKALRGS